MDRCEAAKPSGFGGVCLNQIPSLAWLSSGIGSSGQKAPSATHFSKILISSSGSLPVGGISKPSYRTACIKQALGNVCCASGSINHCGPGISTSNDERSMIHSQFRFDLFRWSRYGIRSNALPKSAALCSRKTRLSHRQTQMQTGAKSVQARIVKNLCSDIHFAFGKSKNRRGTRPLSV